MEGSGRLGRYIMPAGKQRLFRRNVVPPLFFFLPQRQVVPEHTFISIHIPTRAHLENTPVADV